MIEPWAAASADGAPDRFCERCGSPARPDGAVLRVGLTTCKACGIHACQRCWARSVGACPACGVATEATSVLRSLRGTDRAATVAAAPLAMPLARTHAPRAATVAAVAILLALGATAFAFMPRPGAPPAGGVAGIADIPGTRADREAGNGSSPFPSVPATPATTTDRPTAAAGGGEVAGDVSDGSSAGDPGSSDQDPGPTPAPPATPAPTRAPTPEPTPTPPLEPTPTSPPTPAPCIAVAPQLIGELRSDARQMWADAGFTGRVTALAGHGNYVIGSQSRTAGREYPCDSDLTIGPA